MYRICVFVSAGLLASSALFAGEVDVDCTMCHDSAPVPADHMPVDEVTTEACGMCHVAEAEDPYFRTIHEKHGEALGCDTCHTDASAESAARLKQMLGN
ncbi:MAG: hypothetical protein V2I66_07825 [Halieaceae bacterium]|jgi:hypothetical protein|nr:hypothetical protein [Halieaceae bacterium]